MYDPQSLSFTPEDFTGPPTWIMVRCADAYCGHGRAVPLAPWRIRWGVQDPRPLMQKHFRCGVCGRKGCSFDQAPRRYSGTQDAKRWDPEFFPAGQELRMGGARQPGESYRDRDKRVLADYLARYPSGDAILTVR